MRIHQIPSDSEFDEIGYAAAERAPDATILPGPFSLQIPRNMNGEFCDEPTYNRQIFEVFAQIDEKSRDVLSRLEEYAPDHPVPVSEVVDVVASLLYKSDLMQYVSHLLTMLCLFCDIGKSTGSEALDHAINAYLNNEWRPTTSW